MGKNESPSNGIGDRVDQVVSLFLKDPDLLAFCVQHSEHQPLDARAKVKEFVADVTPDEIQQALKKYVERLEPRPGSRGTADRDLEELRAKLQQGLLHVVDQIDAGYRITMGMYTAAFVVGISMLVVSIVSALLQQVHSAVLIGGLGAADVITFLVFKPAQDLQASRGGLAQLQAAFFAWINDIHNWNEYLELLQNEAGTAAPPFEVCKQISEIQGRSTEQMARLISTHTHFAPEMKRQSRSRNKSAIAPPDPPTS